MAIRKAEIQEWLNTLPDDDDINIAIDDGGLVLVVLDVDGDVTDDVLEVGGVPTDQ